jgi:hypothetical protein
MRKEVMIHEFRNRLALDPENQQNRRAFHEAYEWFEGFLVAYGRNAFDKFSLEYQDFYWNKSSIKDLTKKLILYPPIGSSKLDFEPTPTILRSTYFLRKVCGIPLDENELSIANKWKKSEFQAILEIIKQIRNNLFHGMKMNLEENQYKRNKELIAIASELMTEILDNLHLKF